MKRLGRSAGVKSLAAARVAAVSLASRVRLNDTSRPHQMSGVDRRKDPRPAASPRSQVKEGASPISFFHFLADGSS